VHITPLSIKLHGTTQCPMLNFGKYSDGLRAGVVLR